MLPGNINAAVVRCDTLQINRPPKTVHLLHRVELADTLAAPQNALRTLFNPKSRRRVIYRGFLSAIYLNDFSLAKSLLKCLVLENPFCWRLYKAKLGLAIIRKLKIQAAGATAQMWPSNAVRDSQFPSLLTLDYFGFQSNTGQLQGTRVVCRKTIHEKGHCVYGPDYPVTINAQMETGFSISASGEQSPDIVISLDIYDNANDEILVFRHLSGEELGDTKHTFWLRSPVTAGQCLEFRVFWHGLQDITIHSVEIVSRGSVIDSASS